MFDWLGVLLGKWISRNKKPNVVFAERERVEPTLQQIDPNIIVGEVNVWLKTVHRWSGVKWEPICYLPDQSEVTSEKDLPELAPFDHTYKIGTVTWTWDGACWASNSQSMFIHPVNRVLETTRRTGPIPVTPPRLKDMPQRQVTSTERRFGNPHPSDDSAMVTALVMSQIMDTDFDRPSPSKAGGDVSYNHGHSHRDDSPTHSTPTHHSSSSSHSSHDSDYGSSDYGGGSFD